MKKAIDYAQVELEQPGKLETLCSELGTIAQSIEKEFGSPQDIEGCLNGG